MEAGLVAERLNMFISWLKDQGVIKNRNDFAKHVGLSNSTFTLINQGKLRITEKIQKSIKDFYPTININWLMTGEGEMIGDDGYSPQDYHISSLISSMNECINIVKSAHSKLERIETESDNVKIKIIEAIESTNGIVESIANSLGLLGLRVPLINSNNRHAIIQNTKGSELSPEEIKDFLTQYG